MERRAGCLTTYLAVTSLLAALARPTLAQTAADKEQAKVLVAEGRKLRDGNDHKGAQSKFASAYKLVTTPIIGLDLAREHVSLGSLLEALDVCDEIGRLPPKDTESNESKEARGSAATLKTELKARIPKLAIKLKPHAETPKPVVLLDDAVERRGVGEVRREQLARLRHEPRLLLALALLRHVAKDDKDDQPVR